jgi:epoxide hydrolase 4
MIELRHGAVSNYKSSEIHIHYVELNHRPHNPLVIFLHGHPEHWYSWRNYLAAVAAEGYHGAAIDMRGYNESSKPQELEAYHPKHLVEDVRSVIKHLGNKNSFIVGHDWGGLIAWELARQSPQLLSGIVLINALNFESGNTNTGEDDLRYKEKMFFKETHDLKLLTNRDHELYKEALYGAKWREAAKKVCRVNNNSMAWTYEKEIKVPALIIWGRRDVSAAKELSKGIEQYYPKGLTKRFYPNSSHWVHLEHEHNIQNEILYFFSLNRLKLHRPLSSTP